MDDVRRHPVRWYCIIVFAISWGGMLLTVGGPSGLPGTPQLVDALFAVALLGMLAGPTVSGILMTALADGRAGIRDVASRLIRWRVGGRWYAAALLVTPLAMGAVPLVISWTRPAFLPGIVASADRAALVQFSLVAGMMAGVFEELGWTGFAIPHLLRHRSVLRTGLIVGALWAVWHFIINVWTSGDASGALDLPLFLHSLVFSVGILTAYRVLMVWVYNETRSLLLAILMHMSLTTGNILFVPLSMVEWTGLWWSVTVATAFWTLVALVARYSKGGLSQQP